MTARLSRISLLIGISLMMPMLTFAEVSQSYFDLAKKVGYLDYADRMDLTPAEITALYNYKLGDGYHCIQGLLFGQPDNNSQTCYFASSPQGGTRRYAQPQDVRVTIGQIDSAMKKSKPLPANLLLYRGQDSEEFRVGGTFQRKGYTSTSVNLDEARKFDKGALLVIKIPQKGFPGILMGEWEEEVLLPRNTTFKILKIQNTNNEHFVYVEPCIGSCK